MHALVESNRLGPLLKRPSVGRGDPHPGACNANLRLLESIDKTALLAWLQ